MSLVGRGVTWKVIERVWWLSAELQVLLQLYWSRCWPTVENSHLSGTLSKCSCFISSSNLLPVGKLILWRTTRRVITWSRVQSYICWIFALIGFYRCCQCYLRLLCVNSYDWNETVCVITYALYTLKRTETACIYVLLGVLLYIWWCSSAWNLLIFSSCQSKVPFSAH